jgi:hypothetical protein
MTRFRFMVVFIAVISVALFVHTPLLSHMREARSLQTKMSAAQPVADSSWQAHQAQNGTYPNEAGDVIIVMFHRFTRNYSGDQTQRQPYTLTYSRFRSLLQTLYSRNFRLISLSDFINNRIEVPEGKIPMVFTFDDATAGQFHLHRENGGLRAAPDTAVGIMEDFYQRHPDFGLAGTFFINLGIPQPLFDGEGTLTERLNYLVEHGFELGNHTYSHIDLRKVKKEARIIAEVGRNQQALNTYLPGYQMQSLALPFGHMPRHGWLQSALHGEYEGVPFDNRIVLEVGAGPSSSPSASGFRPTAVLRVRAPGRHPEPMDLDWWLRKKFSNRLFISDGNPNIITVPRTHFNRLSRGFIQREMQRLVVY